MIRSTDKVTIAIENIVFYLNSWKGAQHTRKNHTGKCWGWVRRQQEARGKHGPESFSEEGIGRAE